MNAERHNAVSSLVTEVPKQSFSRKTTGRGGPVTFELFKQCYPNLEIIDTRGGGSSCLYESVSEAIVGDTTLANILRAQAVDAIDRNWTQCSEFALAEVADQAQVALDSLGKAECLSLLRDLGTNGHYLWGNAVTLHHLPEVIGMNIVVLTVCDALPFKTEFKSDLASGTILIGFVPEVHFFGVRPVRPENCFQPPVVGAKGETI